jgi:multiple sugar transport system permease protein
VIGAAKQRPWGGGARKASRHLVSPSFREALFGYSLVAPALLAVGAVAVYPLTYALRLSLSRVDTAGRTHGFVGVTNYLNVVRDPAFVPTVERTAYFAGLVLIGTLVLGMTFALVLQRDFWGKSIARGLLVVPWCLSATVVALMYGWIFNAQLGTLNALLHQLGLENQPIIWFGPNGWQTLGLLAFATVWATAPFAALLYLGALQTVPDELFRAARVDGAGPIRRFFAVTLPWVRKTTFLVCVIATISGFSVFVLVFILTNGGPGTETTVLPWWGYTESFTNFDWAGGSAIFFMIAFAIFALSAVFYMLFARGDNA